MTADGRWHTWAEQKMMPRQPPHHTFKAEIKCSHVSLQLLRIPPRCHCCPSRQSPQRARCVSSRPRYRCWRSLHIQKTAVCAEQIWGQEDASLSCNDPLWNPPTAGKGTNLCMMVLLAGLNLLAFLIRTFSPTYQTNTGRLMEMYL